MKDKTLFSDIDTIAFRDGAVIMLDQTLLPGEEKTLHLTEYTQVTEAIRSLRVRGAPAIGIAAAYGLCLAAYGSGAETYDGLRADIMEARDELASARPTAVNLFWALEEMTRVLECARGAQPHAVREALRAKADAMACEDERACRAIGAHGLPLFRDGMGVLTHCNAGTLATVRYGTALAPIYAATEAGLRLRVYADETRPLLQGARLTAWELMRAGVDTTLICDSMAAWVMSRGLVDIALVGCDRVAANGDAANKIGTLGVGVLAKRFGIPFYVCAPMSTIDRDTPDGGHIEIEERGGAEVTELWYKERMAPRGVKVLNPAFDVTPAELISGYITERGILRPPF